MLMRRGRAPARRAWRVPAARLMAKPAAERLLDQIQVALAERVERWSAAIDVIVGPALERASERRTETEQVAAAFER